jgi:hypothetical protein
MYASPAGHPADAFVGKDESFVSGRQRMVSIRRME